MGTAAAKSPGWWEAIPMPAKIAGGAVLTFVAYKFIKNEVNAGRARQLALQQQNLFTNEINAAGAAGEKLSYPLSQYKSFADKLDTAMRDTWFSYGTDTPAVKEVLEALNNNADFLQLQKSFGVRDGWTLQQWITGDFNESERAELNSILQTKGILYSF